MAALSFALLACVREAAADPRLMARLSEEQQQVYLKWREVRSAYDSQHDAYWNAISARKGERRRKHSAGERFTTADFVMVQPPKYAGPALRADIAKVMAEVAPASPDTEIATLPEMIAAAKQHYRFEPSIVAEREFKRRYAVEALAVGLTKDEVTRIYAFETGGRGTFDMQAGINPETKQGRAISTAMGYAQLLAANSISEMAVYGEGFISRLGVIAARSGTQREEAREITAKIEALRTMMRTVRSVPREWQRHVDLSRTPIGYGVHVINLDGHVGPWLQVIKLRGIKDTAVQAGLANASPAELELMNLAGPRTGLEMMDPAGRQAPTANFFSRAAYYRNTIVREKTAAELLAAIDHRMNENMTRPGSIEFAQVFDEVQAGTKPFASDTGRQNLMPVGAPRPLATVTNTAKVPSAVGSAGGVSAGGVSAGGVSAGGAPGYPPLPVRATPPVAAQGGPIPPMPMLVERKPAQPEPAARPHWAPRDLGSRAAPSGFPE